MHALQYAMVTKLYTFAPTSGQRK